MSRFVPVALAGVSMLALSVPVAAQDVVTATEVNASDEIIVTARRRDEGIQEVPLSIAAVTNEQLQELDVHQFEDVSKVVPGLNLTRASGFTAATIRGVDFDPRAAGSSTTVEFYRNDAVTTADALFQTMYDIGQIEVLRGPQGTLRGRASPSGSLTITTHRPDLTEPGGYLSAGVNNQHRVRFEGAINVPIVADKLGIRIAGQLSNSRGNNIFGLNVPLNVIDEDVYDRTRALRASVRADPFDGALVLDFNYETIANARKQYSRDVSLAYATGSTATSDQSPIFLTPEDDLGVGSFAGHNRYTYKIYNWQGVVRQFGQRLTYVGSRIHYTVNSVTNPDGAGLLSGVTPQITPANTGPLFPLYQTLTQTRVTQVTHEVRIQNEDRVFGLFDYVAGFFTVSGNSPTNIYAPGLARVAVPPPLIIVNNPAAAVADRTYTLNTFVYGGTGRYRSDRETSIFGNLTLHLGENTEISGGLRHIWYKANSGVRSTSTPSTDPSTWPDVPAIRRCYDSGNADAACLPTKEATIYAASIKHKFTEDLMAYFSFGTSWRAGNDLVGYCISSCPTAYTVGPVLKPFLSLPDETSKSFEIGIKSAWFDRRLRFNISGFIQKFTNYPLYGSTGVQTLQFDPLANNGAGANVLAPAFIFAAPVNPTIKGFEADLAWDVTPNFKLSAGVAFATSPVKDARIPCVDLNDDNRQDTFTAQNPLTAAALEANIGDDQIDTCLVNTNASSQPRWTGTVQAEYSHPVGFGEAFLRGFMSWKGYSNGDPIATTDQVGAYALFDLFAGIRSEDRSWEATVYAKNLFDVRKVLGYSASPSTSSLTRSTTATYNYVSYRLTEPREVGITLRWAFGSR